MYTKSFLSIVLTVGLLVASCKKKKEDVITLPPVAKKVYAAGYEANSAGFYVGKYWVDTTSITIAVPGSDVVLYDIEVSGTDVYVLGVVDPQSNGPRKYSIWKNGTVLHDNVAASDFRPFTKSMVISGSDIYLCGESYSTTAPIQRPAVWKNGIVTVLPQNLSYSYATNIFVEGSNVFVLGKDYSSTQESVVVWKNGVREVVSTCENGQSIFVLGTDVYVAGTDLDSKPAYWKNGVKTLLPLSSTSGADCHGIKVVGSDVYVSGTESLQTGYNVAVYWKNGNKTTIQPLSPTLNAESFGIDVDDNNVYLCGYVERNNAGDFSAAYWKNGVLTNLTPTSSSAELYAILVK